MTLLRVDPYWESYGYPEWKKSNWETMNLYLLSKKVVTRKMTFKFEDIKHVKGLIFRFDGCDFRNVRNWAGFEVDWKITPYLVLYYIKKYPCQLFKLLWNLISKKLGAVK